MMSDNINTKRIAKNTLLLYIRMILVMVISIYMSRCVLKILGIQDYGIYSVVAGAVAFLGFLNNAMSLATQRFLNFELGKPEGANMRKVFNMSLNIHVIVGLIVVLLAETVGLWIVNNSLNIPTERLHAAILAYHSVVAMTLFSIVQVPFNSAIFAYEKMGIYAYLSIFDVSLKLGLTLLLGYLSYDKLILYSFLMLGVHVLLFFLYVGYVSAKFKECLIGLLWDGGLFKTLAGFLGWNVCGQIAQVLTTQGVNMIANVFYGVVINAAIEITNQVNGAIAMFVNNFQTSFRPQIMKSYAAGDYVNMRELTYKASKVSFYLLYIISLPVMLNIDFILRIWLEDVPAYSAAFCKLLIWYSYLEAIGMPLVMAIMATGHNKKYQIYISIVVSLNLFLSWIFLFIGCSPEWVFYVKIFLSLIVLSVRLYFAEKQSKIGYVAFCKESLLPIIIVILLTQPVFLLMCNFVGGIVVMWKTLLTALFWFYVILCIWYVGFSKGEKVFIKSLLLNKLRRK